jgi:hypothetical protein
LDFFKGQIKENWAFNFWNGYWNERKRKIAFDFTMATFCFILGFLFTGFSLDFDNPFYLQNKNLLLLIGPMAGLVTLGAKDWLKKPNWKTRVSALVLVGIFVAFLHNDPMIGVYLIGMGLFYVFASQHKFFKPLFVILLILPVAANIYFQVKTKNYGHFKNQFIQYVISTDNKTPIITNNFVYFSRKILLEDLPSQPENLRKVADWNKIMGQNPSEFKVFIYKYYRHAYPDEQEFINAFEKWISTSSFQIVEEFEDEWIKTRTFKKMSAEGLLGTFLSPCGKDSVYIEANSEFITWRAIASCQ